MDTRVGCCVVPGSLPVVLETDKVDGKAKDPKDPRGFMNNLEHRGSSLLRLPVESSVQKGGVGVLGQSSRFSGGDQKVGPFLQMLVNH